MTGTAAVRHIVVVGLMGTGKTTVGRELASLLGWPHRDSDADIEAATGRTVRELRDEIGVEAMHGLEAEQLLHALESPDHSVVSPAASTVDVDACRRALRSESVAIVWLTASTRVIVERFVGGAHRPWYGDDPAVFLAEQAAARSPRFRSLAPIEIATDHRSPRDIARMALDALSGRDLAGAPAGGRG